MMTSANSLETDFALKLTILGETYAGKTCLVTRFLHYTFMEIPSTTIGAAFVSKKIEALGKRVTLNIWDTAGSERYQSMTKMYYRGARAAILCYDLTERTSFDKIRYWVGELQENEQHCRIYLCGTKKDLIDNDTRTRAVPQNEAGIIAQDLRTEHFETSSLTGENVEAVFQRIGEDYVRNMHSYPENQPKQEDDTQQAFHIGKSEEKGTTSSCALGSCFKR